MRLTDAMSVLAEQVIREHYELTDNDTCAEPDPHEVKIAEAAYRAGALAMRERAAKACIDEQVDADSSRARDDRVYNTATEHCAAAIHALEVDDE